MTFTSFNFLLFVGILMILYYAIPNKLKKYQWVLLLIANYFFYFTTGVPQIAFIVSSTCVTYCSTMIMSKMRSKGRALAQSDPNFTREQKREIKKAAGAKIKRVQVITILLHLGVLAAVKYLNVTLSNIGSLINIFKPGVEMPRLSMIVPLGISFYTFASIGYILDIAHGKYEPERNPFKVALFVSYFPNIVQGPICRFDDVGVQLTKEHHFDYDRFISGAELILWGFFKKLVIADRAYPLVKTIFSADYAQYSGSQFVFASCIYFFQIYADFSGGIDIARGVSQILGTDLPLNFARPMFAVSVQDYWRRWHITLGAWMRDYVFYAVMLSKPVSGLSKKFKKRFGKFAGKMVPSVITPFVVFFLMGIWHGATFNYILYGLYNAFVVSAATGFEPLFNKMKKGLRVNDKVFSYKIFCMARVFALTSFSRMIVKAPDLHALKFMIKSIITNFNPNFLLGLDGQFFALGIDAKNYLVLFIALLIFGTVSVLQENGMDVRKRLNEQNIAFRWILLIALFIIVLIFGKYGKGFDATGFIYQAY